MTADMMTENEINAIVEEVHNTISSMRKAKLLTRSSVMSYMARNNALLRGHGEKLNEFGMKVGDTRETRVLMIWNEYLKMELERMTGIPSDMRKPASVTAKATTTSRIKIQNVNATTAFLKR